jgi:hypothetical protein
VPVLKKVDSRCGANVLQNLFGVAPVVPPRSLKHVTQLLPATVRLKEPI